MSSTLRFDSRSSHLEDLYITEELGLRPDKPIDYRREAAALQELAAKLSESPDLVLPSFVRLAMELTGATSAGLSLYEAEPAPGVFRWRHLQGLLSPFEYATTPRDFSPCGVTLDRNATVLSKNPERFYDWIAAENLVIPEVLLVPLHIPGDEPIGTLWIVAEHNGQFVREHARVTRQLANFVGLAVRMQRRDLDMRRALDEQETLAMEMSHRLKNVFAMTEGMIRVSAHTADSPGEMAEALTGRIQALSSAHALVRRKAADLGSGESIDLGDLVRAIGDAHGAMTAGETRFQVRGPPVVCGDHAINGMALIIHELATNAAKYGALSGSKGQVRVSWRCEGDRVICSWEESGGPLITKPPVTEGFGTTLTRRTISGQFGGSASFEWLPVGLRVTMDLSASRMTH